MKQELDLIKDGDVLTDEIDKLNKQNINFKAEIIKLKGANNLVRVNLEQANYQKDKLEYQYKLLTEQIR